MSVSADGPAIEWSNGHKEWPGEDGPAIEWSNGHKEWPGEDGPAIEEEFKQKVNISRAEINQPIVATRKS